jgi:AbrB family looped-hinge helix DNA binding protein
VVHPGDRQGDGTVRSGDQPFAVRLHGGEGEAGPAAGRLRHLVNCELTKCQEVFVAASAEFLVSKSGQMSVPADVRRRWGLADGGRVIVIDLGDAVVLLPADARQKLLRDALSAEEHRTFVANLDDPDLATA